MAAPQVRVEGFTDASPGDLLEFDFGPLSHWGVYLGNGEVVHFSWPESTMAWLRDNAPFMVLFTETMIRRQRVSSVVGFSKVYTNRSYDLMLDALTQDEILYRCLIFVDRTLPYHILKFNCEHFATFVRYGKARSQQVSEFDCLHLLSYNPTADFKAAYREALRDFHDEGPQERPQENRLCKGCTI